MIETYDTPKPKILLLGHGRHGKDTVAELMRDLCDIKFESSSWAALDAIWPALDVATEYKYETKEDAFNNRSKDRLLWKELISLYNAADRCALTKLIISKNDLYAGMRSYEEYVEAKDLFNMIVWVDASDRRPEDPSMAIPYDAKTMHLINNNGDLDDLALEVSAFCKKHHLF